MNAGAAPLLDPNAPSAAAPARFAIGFDTSALDETFKAHAARGIGRYVRELKRYFDARAASEGDTGLCVGEFDHRQLTLGNSADRIVDRLPFGRHTVRQQLLYPMRLSKVTAGRFDALHFPAHMDAPSWSVRRYALTVLDLIPMVCRDLYRADRPGWRFHLARWLEMRAIKNASLVLAISENTARDVRRLLGIPAERIVVTPLGVDERFFAAPRMLEDASAMGALRRRLDLPADRPVVLYVGGIDQRKNWKGLLEVHAELVRRRSEPPRRPALVMVGKIENDEHFPALKARIAELGLEGDVRLAGFLNDEELLRAYALSTVFFFPSLYEGFGLTPLEAMAAGVAVVSSNTSAMPEVIGDAAVPIDPSDVRACAEAVDALLSDGARRLELQATGRARAARFTWERTGKATLEAYRLLAGRVPA
jgi:glycosyltransferase involved in cell wall biosynthesis